MTDDNEFSTLYKRMMRKNITPNPERFEEALQAVLLQAFSRDPPGGSAKAIEKTQKHVIMTSE